MPKGKDDSWMAENLKLENEAIIGNNINNSTITNRSFAQGYGGVFTGLAVMERDTFWGTGADNTLYYCWATRPSQDIFNNYIHSYSNYHASISK